MRYFVLYFFYLIWCSAGGQVNASFTTVIRGFYEKKTAKELESYWTNFIQTNKIPFVSEDSVAFFYRGKANSVDWMGDFNGWGYDKSFPSQGQQILLSDIWILKASFPKDARLDYKIVVDGSNWMIDPLNPDQQWSGVGGGSPNSELRMPEWKVDPFTQLLPEAPRGNVINDLLLSSSILNYQVTYSLYLPPTYVTLQKYPIVYVLDGYEYMHEHMGNMITILNNLSYLKKIKPVVAVFIDQREPVNRANNRRMQELAMNEKYLNFLTEELMPLVEKKYHISDDKNDRAILGNSMGGLAAAYFAFARPNVFGLVGIQSPAFWFRSSIYTVCDNPEHPPVKIFMTTGVLNDAEEGARKMKGILEKNTCTYQYKEVDQGHSWGNWRDLIDDILIYFFPAK